MGSGGIVQQLNVSGAAGVEHNDRDTRSRVGNRKRSVNWRESVPSASFRSSDDEATVPVNLALVPIMVTVDLADYNDYTEVQ